MSQLWVVMPAYNEEACVGAVVEEWLPVLRREAADFTFCALNDGSRDGTLAALTALARAHPELQVVDKPNSGHGQSCMLGYRTALAAGAAWVLQIDSDGQCDPRFFPAFWAARAAHPAIYGFRRQRDDGWKRMAISRIVSAVTFVGSGTWVRDPNVPYRLMHRSTLERVIDRVPADFHLANVLVAALQAQAHGIHWVDIHFRNRIGGTPSVKAGAFAKHGRRLLEQLWRQRNA